MFLVGHEVRAPGKGIMRTELVHDSQLTAGDKVLDHKGQVRIVRDTEQIGIMWRVRFVGSSRPIMDQGRWDRVVG